MKIELRREKIRRRGIPCKKSRKLYLQAFPKVERVSFGKIFRCCKRSSGDLWAFYDGKRFVGFACVLLGSYAYLLFCAVEPELRGKGYGSAMITNLRQAYAWMDMILDIEPPDESAPNAEERNMRYEFYVRSGFKDTGWEMTDGTGDFRIFSADGRLDPKRLESMYSLLPSMFPETEIVKAEDNIKKRADKRTEEAKAAEAEPEDATAEPVAESEEAESEPEAEPAEHVAEPGPEEPDRENPASEPLDESEESSAAAAEEAEEAVPESPDEPEEAVSELPEELEEAEPAGSDEPAEKLE